MSLAQLFWGENLPTVLTVELRNSVSLPDFVQMLVNPSSKIPKGRDIMMYILYSQAPHNIMHAMLFEHVDFLTLTRR